MLVGFGSVYAIPDYSGSIWPSSRPDADDVGVGLTPIPNPIRPDSNPEPDAYNSQLLSLLLGESVECVYFDKVVIPLLAIGTFGYDGVYHAGN